LLLLSESEHLSEHTAPRDAREGAAREFTDDYLRTIMQKRSTDKQWELPNRITQLGKALSNLRANLEISADIPELGIGKG